VSLSQAWQQVGVRSIAVSKTTQRAQGNRIFICDVTKEAELGMLRSFFGRRARQFGMGALYACLWDSFKGT